MRSLCGIQTLTRRHPDMLRTSMLLRRLKDMQTQLQDIVNPSVSEEPTGACVKSPPSITYTKQSAKRWQKHYILASFWTKRRLLHVALK
ncbi:hypothetical protein DPMN_162190 [Dreissena polymorpha]|uniref:Uncharacterized protein n=2 Tax=Dreissena polymorpha TaxID=45954 RepID=A0A9D4ITF8_DREPO|nr:hypothetical protein DPMN_162190 [Dreissena polymorpha]